MGWRGQTGIPPHLDHKRPSRNVSRSKQPPALPRRRSHHDLAPLVPLEAAVTAAAVRIVAVAARHPRAFHVEAAVEAGFAAGVKRDAALAHVPVPLTPPRTALAC